LELLFLNVTNRKETSQVAAAQKARKTSEILSSMAEFYVPF